MVRQSGLRCRCSGATTNLIRELGACFCRSLACVRREHTPTSHWGLRVRRNQILKLLGWLRKVKLEKVARCRLSWLSLPVLLEKRIRATRFSDYSAHRKVSAAEQQVPSCCFSRRITFSGSSTSQHKIKISKCRKPYGFLGLNGAEYTDRKCDCKESIFRLSLAPVIIYFFVDYIV